MNRRLLSNRTRIAANCFEENSSVQHIRDILPAVLARYLAADAAHRRGGVGCQREARKADPHAGSLLWPVLAGMEVEHVGVVQEGI